MFDDLEHYLTTLMPGRVSTILNILNSIGNLVGPDPIVEFSQYSLGVPTDVDTMEEIARFDDALENLIISSFGELGITLDEDQYDSGKLLVIEQILEAIENVINWQDVDRLMAIMVDTDNHEMAIAELVSEISGEADDTPFVLLIASVSDAFYDNLLSLIQSNADSDQAQIAATTGGPLTRVKEHFQNKPESFVSKAIRQNVLTFGLDYPFYLKFYENYLWDLTPQELATALVDFAVCSNVPDGDIGPTAIKAIGEYAETIEQGQSYQQIIRATVAELPERFNQPVGEPN